MRLPRRSQGKRSADTLGVVRSSHLGVVVVVALLGLVLAASIAYAASRLVSQPIGLTSEPADVGESLAPLPASQTPGKPTTTSPQPAVRTPTVQSPPTTQESPSSTADDDSRSRHGADGDHDADDD